MIQKVHYTGQVLIGVFQISLSCSDMLVPQYPLADLRRKYGLSGDIPLTEDDRAKLRESLPACIRAILNIEEKPADATCNYNLLLLVLIGFFQTVGFAYDDAATVCSDFIERYPSSTYETPDRRLSEFRKKWIYLDAKEAYHFACSFARSLKLPSGTFSCYPMPAR
jgi:hypothetical protein